MTAASLMKTIVALNVALSAIPFTRMAVTIATMIIAGRLMIPRVATKPPTAGS